MPNNSRTEFETWANQSGHDLRRLDGHYTAPTTESAWQAWDTVYQSTSHEIRSLLEQLNGAI